jgi:hypothetical protein
MIIWTVADAIVPTLGVAWIATALLFSFAAPWSRRPRRRPRRPVRA